MPAPVDFDASAERSRIAETLLASSARLLRVRNELEIIKGVCESMCNASSHIRLAWTWFGPTGTDIIRPQVYAGSASEYAANMTIDRNLLTDLGPAFRTLRGEATEAFKISRWSLFGPWREVSRSHGVRSVLAVPLHSSFSEMAGIFVIYADRERYFEQVGEGLFIALGALFSSVLSASAERVELEQVINHDPLTGLLNRRALTIVERRIARQSLFDPKSFVLVVDLDHFKAINDTHGHATGDEVLRRASSAMRNLLRRDDDVMRWGGEEFLVCLANTSQEDALKVAEKLRAAIEALRAPVPVTASIGVAEVMPQRALSDAIDIADKALFDAKQGGRNRVCMRV
ncbi:GGDEF domain-containing protein [Rhodoferax sp.]|uniref:GGDEF domain-containing protein n=1 Tax=Rhodoferax sp. TaxID=50421 RepID=UPI00374DEA3A